MSSRSILLLAALAAVLALPAASAQTAHTVTIEIQDLPASAESNGTALVVPFSVHATVAGAGPCLANGGTTYTIALSAEVTNSTGNHTTAIVNPKQYTMAGPTLLPTAGGSAERTQEAQLTVFPGPYADSGLNATIKVTASFTGGNPDCTGAQATTGSEDTAELKAGFTPVPALYGTTPGNGQAMPGPGAVLVMAALAAVVIALRRKA
ncbi:MAG: hypothetical protein QOC71_1774 [Thermoplasmata archaeon]|jgi:hypothetical protein|nr:hypothetical protein [Thermoplasmata archaeon]